MVPQEIIKKINESKLYAKPIVTEVTEAAKMYVAEDYHINYFNKNPVRLQPSSVVSKKAPPSGRCFSICASVSGKSSTIRQLYSA